MGGLQTKHNQGTIRPDADAPLIFDSLKGFPEGRKERVMPLTADEMENAKIPLADRDYCADKYMTMQVCVKKNYPANWRCKHQKHSLNLCRYDDQILRFKEYERERRLLERQARKERKAKRLADQEALGE